VGFVIAILITLAVAGSILWVMPSKRELRLTGMRQKALAHGLKVRLLDEKLAKKFFPWVDNYREYVLYENHSMKLPKGQELVVYRTSSDEDVHELDKLRANYLNAEALSLDANLPASHEAVVVYPSGIGVLWREQGDVEAVDQLAESVLGIERWLNSDGRRT
jgi:hypothetical protein